MDTIQLYCATCKRHTPHRHQVAMYATQCSVCNCLTSQLERSHVENLHYSAPDGVEGRVVENTPEVVTFYIPSGDFEGYYYYNKGTRVGVMSKDGKLPA